ncbi:MAG: HAEPLYID family protein [Chitinophagaceae bacterium]
MKKFKTPKTSKYVFLRMKHFYFLICSLIIFNVYSFAQVNRQDSIKSKRAVADSLFILETEGGSKRDKVLHAEPLYIDLMRDLGARKGEKEWNVGLGMTDKLNYNSYLALVEYEFAPLDRLGLEIELPFEFNSAITGSTNPDSRPGNRLKSLKLGAQYTFYVSEEKSTSAAIAYLHEFKMVEFSELGNGSIWAGNIYNPFFVIAKRWGANFHTLLYTGPSLERFKNEKYDNWEINANIHYMIAGSHSFIGLETNMEVWKNKFVTVFRPQMRLVISDQLMLGIVLGIPANFQAERLSSFLRLIYEPGGTH